MRPGRACTCPVSQPPASGLNGVKPRPCSAQNGSTPSSALAVEHRVRVLHPLEARQAFALADLAAPPRGTRGRRSTRRSSPPDPRGRARRARAACRRAASPGPARAPGTCPRGRRRAASSELRICRRMRSGASPVSPAPPSVEWNTFVESVTGCPVSRDPAAEPRLAAPAAVGVGRVVRRDPGRPGGVEDRVRLLLALALAEERGRRADAAEVAAAEDDARDVDAAAAERAPLHQGRSGRPPDTSSSRPSRTCTTATSARGWREPSSG